jgi:hypothetical protein
MARAVHEHHRLRIGAARCSAVGQANALAGDFHVD